MRVLIVAKTRMNGTACVGGFALKYNRNVRLLQPNGANQPQDTPYEVGDIWELNAWPKHDVVAPHVEDVIVDSGWRVGHQDNIRSYLLARVRPWQGGPDQLFDGLLRFTQNGSGYICRRHTLPKGSVGFWLPSCDLRRSDQYGRIRIQMRMERHGGSDSLRRFRARCRSYS